MSTPFFVTGTDTDVGKTLVSTAILYAAAQQGLTTAAIKPLAAGCEQTPQGLRNDDALQLQQVITAPLSYEQINPVALESAVSPHIAAHQAGKRLTAERLAGYCRALTLQKYDCLIVEGAGGWRVPINHRETLADLARLLSLPVIVVVGVRLGCLNHALLTCEAIARDRLPIAGWVANQLDPAMAAYDDNVATLTQAIDAPCLGEIPFLAQPTAANAAAYLDIAPLISPGKAAST